MRFRLTLVVWGDWYISQLVAHGLPSLRAPGNLDAVEHHIAVRTRPADLERVKAALEGLNAEVAAPLPDDQRGDQGTSNNTVFGFNMQDRADAAAAGEAWALLAPDMVWGEGTLAHHRRALEGGKKAVFRPLLRVDAARVGPIRDFGKRNLARIAVEHEHDVARRQYRANGDRFSSHAEMIIWEAPGGLLNRTITGEVQVCLPSAVPLNGCGLAAVPLDPGEACVVGDSDEAIALALAPPDKDFGWLRGTEPLRALTVRNFLGFYDSPAARSISATSYRLHAGDVDPASWADAEARADEFMRSVFDHSAPGDTRPR